MYKVYRLTKKKK